MTPLSTALTLGKREESHGAKSGEFIFYYKYL